MSEQYDLRAPVFRIFAVILYFFLIAFDSRPVYVNGTERERCEGGVGAGPCKGACGISPHRSGFDPRTLRVRYVVDSGAGIQFTLGP